MKFLFNNTQIISPEVDQLLNQLSDKPKDTAVNLSLQEINWLMLTRSELEFFLKNKLKISTVMYP